MSKKKPTSKLCNDYLALKENFKWFIERFFGLKKYVELWDLAEEDRESDLRRELNDIWYSLPDGIFNVQNNPKGWDSFLSLIDD